MAKKRSSKTKTQNIFRFNKPTAIVLAVVLALVGAVIVLRASASSPTEMANLVLDYQVGGSAMGNKKADGSVSMTQQPTQTQITSNGELICYAGNPDSMNLAMLTKSEVDKITSTVSGHLSSIKDQFIGKSDGNGGTFVIDPTTITVVKSGKVDKTVSVDSSAQKPGGFTAAENFLKQTCKKATKTTPLAELPLMQGTSRVGSIVNSIAEAAIPSAYAVTVTARPNSESLMLYNTNSHRGNDPRRFNLTWPPHPLNKFAYPSIPCLNKAARSHSTFMANNGYGHHPSSTAFSWLAGMCGGYGPTAWGENIAAWAGSPTATDSTITTATTELFGAWMKSNGHHLAIDGGDMRAWAGGQAANEFNRMGNGAVTFIRTNSNGSKNTVLYLTQEFVHCDATCGGNRNYDK